MIRVTTFSEAGGHPENEDAFVVQPHPSVAETWLCLLADGQGGQSGGAEASRVACRVGMEVSVRFPIQELRNPDSWLAILSEADHSVAANPGAGYTTLVGFVITGDFVAGASCGDSAVMMITGGEAARDLTRGQRKNPPVGSGVADFVPFSAGLAWPWSVLAMSDGVWKPILWDRLVEAAGGLRGESLLERLKGLARSPRSGRFPDDFTVVAFQDNA